MKVVNGIFLKEDINLEMSKVFVDAFYEDFKSLKSDKQVLYKAFEHIFNSSLFYVAIDNDEIVGFVTCTDGYCNSMNINQKIFKKYFGFIKGTIISKILKSNFEKNPIKRGNREGFIELLAVSPQHQGKGIGKKLLNRVIIENRYKSYVLEVADTNATGVKLYEKTGFKEFKRFKHKFAKQSGINDFIWMEYNVA